MIESYNKAAESKDTDSDAESKKDSKPSVNKKKLGTFTAKNVVEAPNIHRPKTEKSTLWDEILGKDTKREKEEKGLPTLEKSPDSATLDEKKVETAAISEPGSEIENEQTEKDVENFEAGEPQEVVRRIAEARAAEIREQKVDAENNEPSDVKDAASLVLMESVQKKLSENPEMPVEVALDEAETETTKLIEGEPAENSENKELEESNAPEQPEGPTEGEIPLHAESNEGDDDNTILIPRSGGGSGTASPPPGGGGSRSSGSGAGGSGGSGGGNVPPITPGGGSVPPLGGGGQPGPFGAGFNAAPISVSQAPGISMEDLQSVVHRQERAAIAQGLLIGGIVGYLIGRRRGRIKTEKRLLPIQQKLEAQVKGLQSSVLEREQKIRDLAAEKAREMTNEEARTRFVNKLAHEDAIRAKAGERQLERTQESSRTLQLGRVLVEAPAVALTGTAVARQAELGIQKPKAVAIPIKKIENYSGPELKLAAEKIRIDGTTLKEMWDRGQLSEKSVERVITDFMEGHSVRAALNRELFDEEARFEIDPKLRSDGKKSQKSSGGGSGGQSDAAQAGAALLLRELGENDSTSKHTSDKKDFDKDTEDQQKEPSAFEKARNDPTIQLATAGVVGAILFIVAILIFA